MHTFVPSKRIFFVVAVILRYLVIGAAVPAAAVATGTGIAPSVAHQSVAHASSGSVLILSTSVNGGSSSAEAQAATADGYTVTVISDTTWQTESQSYFSGFSAIILGDPSTSGTCASSASTGIGAASNDFTTWGPAIDGNTAVLGAAPVYANTAGATKMMDDGISYAASGGSGKTGLYVSLNCYYASASEDTWIQALASVFGGPFDVQGGNCNDDGTLNTRQTESLSAFGNLTNGDLNSLSCPAEETFDSWPSALTPMAYDSGATPSTAT